MTVEELPAVRESSLSRKNTFCLDDGKVKNKMFAMLKVADKMVCFLINSGAMCNVIGQEDVDPAAEIKLKNN